MNIETALKNLDRPIQSFEEDLLNRHCFVGNLCRVFRSASSHESTVFALYGEWGSGKTSVKNLLRKEFETGGDESPIAIEFNPWAFSGQDQVLEAFFTEVGKAVGNTFDGKDAAEGFKKLGAYLSFGAKAAKSVHIGMDLFGIPGAKLVGLVGEGLESGSKSAKQYDEDLETVASSSLEKAQSQLVNGLRKLKRPLLIILDDIDRLAPDQLLTIFQIVKQNANLPGVNYLMLMDIKTISERLEQKGLGPEFIEKIVQFDLTLPHISDEELKAILRVGFKEVAGRFEAQIEWRRWDEAWNDGAQHLFTTLRRVKRFLHTLKFSLTFFENDNVLEVDPVDLFLIEAVRKFAPDTYSAIARRFRDSVVFEIDLLRIARAQRGEKNDEHGKKHLKELIQLAPVEIRSPLERILSLLFPQINGFGSDADRNEWLRTSRICDQLSFDSYFRMIVPQQIITQKEMADLFAAVADQLKLRTALMPLYEKSGIATLFHRISCHRKKLDAKYLSNLLAELWRLEDLQAEKDGVERDWSQREFAQHLTRLLLHEFSTKSNRCSVVTAALTTSQVFYPLAFIWCRDHQVLVENPSSIRTSFDLEELSKLRAIILTEIHSASSDGRLLRMPDLGFCLLMWKDIENKETVQKWLDEQSKDQPRLLTILKALLNKVTTTGYRGMEHRFLMTRQNLEQFFNPIEKLEPLLRGLDQNILGKWEKFALEETLKRIEEKQRGIQEAEYADF